MFDASIGASSSASSSRIIRRSSTSKLSAGAERLNEEMEQRYVALVASASARGGASSLAGNATSTDLTPAKAQEQLRVEECEAWTL